MLSTSHADGIPEVLEPLKLRRVERRSRLYRLLYQHSLLGGREGLARDTGGYTQCLCVRTVFVQHVNLGLCRSSNTIRQR